MCVSVYVCASVCVCVSTERLIERTSFVSMSDSTRVYRCINNVRLPARFCKYEVMCACVYVFVCLGVCIRCFCEYT